MRVFIGRQLVTVYVDIQNVDGYASVLKFALGMGFAGADGAFIRKQVGVGEDVFA